VALHDEVELCFEEKAPRNRAFDEWTPQTSTTGLRPDTVFGVSSGSPSYFTSKVDLPLFLR
jgi:hypothetical protein